MSIFHDRATDLEHEEFKSGPIRGRLAVTLDVLTDALILVGQHNVYCHHPQPAHDLKLAQDHLQGAKDLVQSVLEELDRPADIAQRSRADPV